MSLHFTPSFRSLKHLGVVGAFFISACEMPISQIQSNSDDSVYTPDPSRPPVAEENDAPWDMPWDSGSNPYHEVADIFEITNRAKQVDVLFVMDNSGSMAQEQNGVVDSFSKFLEGFVAERIDYHIGVISTDTKTSSSYWGGLGQNSPYFNFPNAGPGSLLAFKGNPKFISSASGRSEALRQFRLNATLGTTGSGAESGLLAVQKSLATSKIQSGAWNAEFFRNDALLSVVVVSDEDESVGASTTRYIKRDLVDETNRIEQFVASLRNLKPNRPDLIRLDLVIAPSQEACPTVGSDNGVLGTGDTYIKAYEALYSGVLEGKGKVMNVCKDFSSELGDLGSQIAIQVERRFQLKKPVEGELKIFFNGQAISESSTNGYTYSAQDQTLTLHGLDLENLDQFTVKAEYIAKK
jgi:hypothetical protein